LDCCQLLYLVRGEAKLTLQCSNAHRAVWITLGLAHMRIPPHHRYARMDSDGDGIRAARQLSIQNRGERASSVEVFKFICVETMSMGICHRPPG
jgi:hypothetical protein